MIHKALQGILDVFKELQTLDLELQAELGECLKAFYKLSRDRSLNAKPARRPDGKVRAIYMVSRSDKAFRWYGNRKVRLNLHLKNGPINDGMLYDIARDFPNREAWREADRVRLDLNARAKRRALLLRNFRFALAYRFEPKATDQDRARAFRLLTECAFLRREDTSAVLGAVVYDRLLADLERKISGEVDRWKEKVRGVTFEPLIRWRASGYLRLSWAYVERFYDSKGQFQVRSQDIPGGVTDRWLRKHPPVGGATSRREILGYVTRLRTLTREYSKLLVTVGRLKAEVRRSLSEDESGARPVAGAQAIEGL